MSETERVVNDLDTAKLILCNPQMLTPEMCIRIGQAITSAIALLKEQEEQIKNRDESLEKAREEIKWLRGMLKEQDARELTIDEWREWKNNPKRNPICKLWEHDTSPMWVLNPNNVHEPALLMGKLKLFTGKPTFEQCMEVKWE